MCVPPAVASAKALPASALPLAPTGRGPRGFEVPANMGRPAGFNPCRRQPVRDGGRWGRTAAARRRRRALEGSLFVLRAAYPAPVYIAPLQALACERGAAGRPPEAAKPLVAGFFCTFWRRNTVLLCAALRRRAEGEAVPVDRHSLAGRVSGAGSCLWRHQHARLAALASVARRMRRPHAVLIDSMVIWPWEWWLHRSARGIVVGVARIRGCHRRHPAASPGASAEMQRAL